MIQKIMLAIQIILFSISVLSAQQADDIIGTYRLPNNLDIEISKVNQKYQGKIVAVNKNIEGSLQDESILGDVIIHKLEFDKSSNKWVNGTMYSPKKGLTFNLQVNEIREKEIEVVGSKLFFWKTMTWKRL